MYCPLRYRGQHPEIRTAQNYPETEDRASLCHRFDRDRFETRKDQDRRVPRSQEAWKAAAETISRVSSYPPIPLGNERTTAGSGRRMSLAFGGRVEIEISSIDTPFV